MTPHLSSPGGSFRLDKRVKGVGRIRVATGITDPAIWRDHFAPLWRELLRHRARYLELLKAIRDKRVRVDDLVDLYRKKGFDAIPSEVQAAVPLKRAVDRWLASLEATEKTPRDYRYCLHAIRGDAEDATVPELPALLRKYRERAKPRMFNLAREACRAFARDIEGRHKPLWVDVTSIQPRKVTAKAGRPCMPDEARTIAKKLEKWGGMWWTLCCTGMSGGPTGPYFRNRFTIKSDRILIHGTKQKGRERVIPRLTTPVRPIVKHQAFREALSGIGRSPNDGRHTFKAWCEMAGIPKARIRRYMGHGAQDVTDLYGQEYSLEQFLVEDAKRFTAYVGPAPRWLEVAK